MVRHKGRDFSFDWSTAKDEVDHGSIRWAAFYSDCEHEVLEVTSGHRVTLTYNLYAVRGNGSLAGYCPTLDASHLPLYRSVEALLQDARFMEHGELLSFVKKSVVHNVLTIFFQGVILVYSATMRMRTVPNPGICCLTLSRVWTWSCGRRSEA